MEEVPIVKDKPFLDAVQAATGLTSRRDAERWAKAVVSALVQMAPDSEARRQFVTQLPRVVKAQLREQMPGALALDREALIQHVGAALGVHAPEAQRALRAVWGVLERSVSAGELADFLARVPADVAAFLEAA